MTLSNVVNVIFSHIVSTTLVLLKGRVTFVHFNEAKLRYVAFSLNLSVNDIKGVMSSLTGGFN